MWNCSFICPVHASVPRFSGAPRMLPGQKWQENKIPAASEYIFSQFTRGANFSAVLQYSRKLQFSCDAENSSLAARVAKKHLTTFFSFQLFTYMYLHCHCLGPSACFFCQIRFNWSVNSVRRLSCLNTAPVPHLLYFLSRLKEEEEEEVCSTVLKIGRNCCCCMQRFSTFQNIFRFTWEQGRVVCVGLNRIV